MTDSELLALNQRGFIPGPGESVKDFSERVQAAFAFFAEPVDEFRKMERVALPHWDWVCHHLREMYDFQPDSLIAFYSNRKLAPWQGAASWIIDTKPGPLCAVQLRQGFRTGSYLGLYSRDEILAHEAAHAARCAFEEPKSEEYFAYLTSPAKWRQVLGPMVQRSWEAALFLGSLALCAILGNYLLATGLLSCGFIRLIRYRIRLKRAGEALEPLLRDKKKMRAVLFRLTDREIERLSKGQSIDEDGSLRLRMIRTAYFT